MAFQISGKQIHLYLTLIFIFITLIAASDDFSTITASYHSKIVVDSEDSSLSLKWKRAPSKTDFLLQLDTQQSMQSADEVRLCFEIERYDETTQYRVASFIIFYGNAGDGRFTEMAKGENIDDKYYNAKWLCSKPRTDSNVEIIGIDNEEYKIFGVNSIDKDRGQAHLQFQVPEEFTKPGSNPINLAWGVFPSSSSEDQSYSRDGGSDSLSIFIPFSFIELYDQVFSFWLGLAMWITAQFFGFTFPLAIISSFVLFVYDLIKLIECFNYVQNVSDTQVDEFTWENFMYYPLKRFVINALVYELPLSVSAVIKAILNGLSGTILSNIAITNNWQTWQWMALEAALFFLSLGLTVVDGLLFGGYLLNIYYALE